MKKIISAILVAVMVSCSVIGFCGSETFAATSIAEDQANLSKLEAQKGLVYVLDQFLRLSVPFLDLCLIPSDILRNQFTTFL